MKNARPSAQNVDEYIAAFPENVRQILQHIRETITKAVPEATETISYQIAAFKFHGILLYFAGYKNHVSIYPAPRDVSEFSDELMAYKGGKGTVQFPIDKAIPFDLIERIAKFRKAKNLEQIKAKAK